MQRIRRSNLSAIDWYSLSDKVTGCRTRTTGIPSPSLIFVGKGASTGSGGGDGARRVGAFFFGACGVAASETRLLAAGSRPARGGNLRFSAIVCSVYAQKQCRSVNNHRHGGVLGAEVEVNRRTEGGKSVTRDKLRCLSGRLLRASLLTLASNYYG